MKDIIFVHGLESGVDWNELRLRHSNVTNQGFKYIYIYIYSILGVILQNLW